MITRTISNTLASAALAMAILIPAASVAHACACCGTYVVVNVADWDTLNVRAGPGTHFRVETELIPGTCGIELTGRRQGDWIEIQSGGIIGWVHGHYIKWTP